MSDTVRIISVVILVALSFFCVQAGVFLCSGHKIKRNSRRTLVLLEIVTGILLAFDSLAYIFRGSPGALGYHMVRASNFLVFFLNYVTAFFFCFYSCEFVKSDSLDFKILRSPRASVQNGIPIQLFVVFYICLGGILLLVASQFTNLLYYFDERNFYHRSALYPLSVALGLSPGLITFSMLYQRRKELPKNVLFSLAIYCVFPLAGVFLALFFYGFSWINFGYGLGALHLFYSSLKLLEIEFYSDRSDVPPLDSKLQASCSSSRNEKENRQQPFVAGRLLGFRWNSFNSHNHIDYRH